MYCLNVQLLRDPSAARMSLSMHVHGMLPSVHTEVGIDSQRSDRDWLKAALAPAEATILLNSVGCSLRLPLLPSPKPCITIIAPLLDRLAVDEQLLPCQKAH